MLEHSFLKRLVVVVVVIVVVKERIRTIVKRVVKVD